MNENKPKVTVCVVTYNQAKYIRACLQSLVDQIAMFRFEVLVSDDCSTDGTLNIVREFESAYPNIFNVYAHSKNIGAFANFIFIHEQATGEYICHMDGDDIAMPGKLQKQSDVLDKYPQCGFAVHRMLLFSAKNHEIVGLRPNTRVRSLTSIEQLIEGYLFFSHSSKMYRSLAKKAPVAGTLEVIDFYRHIEHAKYGPIFYDDQVLGAYRCQSVGALTSAATGQTLKLFSLTLNAFDRALGLGIDAKVVARGKSHWLAGASLHLAELGDRASMLQYVEQWLAQQHLLGKRRQFINFMLRNLPGLLFFAASSASALRRSIQMFRAKKSERFPDLEAYLEKLITPER